MRGFILAAGFGTRLKPLTEQIPKALVPVAGTPLLGHALQFLSDNGISTIGVNTHYLPEKIEQYRKQSHVPFTIFFEEGTIRGTGGAFHFAREFLSGDEEFFVVNADILAHYSLNSAINFFRASDALCVLLAFPPQGRGTLIYNKETQCYCGTPKDTTLNDHSHTADFIGAALYKKEFLDYVTPEDFSIVPTWSRACEDGKKVLVYIINHGFWRDIGTLKALLDIHCDILDKSIEIPLPLHLSINYTKKICTTSQINPSDNFGPYSWIESDKLPDDITTSRSIVLQNATIAGFAHITNSIVTTQGVLKVND